MTRSYFCQSTRGWARSGWGERRPRSRIRSLHRGDVCRFTAAECMKIRLIPFLRETLLELLELALVKALLMNRFRLFLPLDSFEPLEQSEDLNTHGSISMRILSRSGLGWGEGHPVLLLRRLLLLILALRLRLWLAPDRRNRTGTALRLFDDLCGPAVAFPGTCAGYTFRSCREANLVPPSASCNSLWLPSLCSGAD